MVNCGQRSRSVHEIDETSGSRFGGYTSSAVGATPNFILTKQTSI